MVLTTERTKELEIVVERIVDPLDSETVWQVYDKSFEELKAKLPCRQSFHKDEFDAFMVDPEVLKFLVYMDGQLVAGSFITANFDKVPWISRPFYDAKYPQYIGSRVYAQSFFIKPGSRARGYLEALGAELANYLRKEGVKICFCDYGGRNKFLFSLLLRAGKAKALGTIDTQVYDAIVFS